MTNCRLRGLRPATVLCLYLCPNDSVPELSREDDTNISFARLNVSHHALRVGCRSPFSRGSPSRDRTWSSSVGGTLLVILKGTPFHKQTMKRNIKQRTPQSTGVTPVLCCRDYHRGKCRHDNDHFGTIRGNKKWLQCICAKCSLERHPEFSSHCPRLRTKTARRSNLLPHHDYRLRIQRISAKRGTLGDCQHRNTAEKKITNTASPQKRLTKHRHRNSIFVLRFK